MVKVWYEPPPFGPRSSLDRPSYGLIERGTPRWVIQLSKAPSWQVMTGTVIVFSAVAWIPLMGQKLPFTMSPEYEAAQRAYMRYHNMNPIYGLSSKTERPSGN